jgi:hypothetical protein
MANFAPGVVARSIGSVLIDDGVNSRMDRYEVPGTAYVQAEQLFNQGGAVAIVKTDKKGLVITVTGVFMDGGGVQWEDFVAALEAQQNVVFDVGDDTGWANVYVTDIVGTIVAVVSPGPPIVRILRWALKLTCLSPVKVAV